jgi:aspartyl-tRNA(Asn)/glutamyl-tRNA(Gln) amidotransferase subunit A
MIEHLAPIPPGLTPMARARQLNAFTSMLSPRDSGPGARVAVKDLIDVRGSVTTGGGRVFPRMPAASDAAVIGKLRAARCCLVAKTNMDEWAYGALGANHHFGDVSNPWAPERIAGGSSSGSAVAVALGAVDWAIGTDTGGSIRIPASLCGVVGFKPTVGTIDKSGVIALSETLDTVGSLARGVRTAVEAVELMAGVDLHLPSTPAEPGEFRIGVPRAWIAGLDRPTATAWKRVAGDLPEVDLGDRLDAAEPALVILDFEAAMTHGESLREDPERYSAAIAAKLRRSLRLTVGAYERALVDQQRVRQAIATTMAGWDAILLPTTTAVAPVRSRVGSRERLTRYIRPFNTTGQPVITIPAPTESLPVGIQVVGAPGADSVCARVALALEHAWSKGA